MKIPKNFKTFEKCEIMQSAEKYKKKSMKIHEIVKKYPNIPSKYLYYQSILKFLNIANKCDFF